MITRFILFLMLSAAAFADDLSLRLRTRVQDPDGAEFVARESTARWDSRKTALIICDLWDQHWCKSAARRVAEMAGPLNDMAKAARARGIFIIHAPSTCMEFYKDTPQRKRAQAAPFAPTPQALVTTERWGTAWCWTDARREGVLPIDDSDMGCDCAVKCAINPPWKRQIKTI